MSSYSEFKVDLENQNSSWTIIHNLVRPGSKILDIGCSSGYFDEVLIQDKRCVIDGVELDPADAKRAKAICRKVIIGNVEDTGFDWQQLEADYDYVFFIDVLEHLLDPAKTLRNVSKLLGKNGKIIFSVPNMANGSVRLQLLQGNFDYEKEGLLDATHLHYYTLETVRKMVSDSGLYLSELQTTTFDTPTTVIDSVLKNVGLKKTPAFTDFINSKDSLAYQFIGVLDTRGPAIDLGKARAAIKPKLRYEQQLAQVQADARKVFSNFEKLNQIIESQQARITELELHARPLVRKVGAKIKRHTPQTVKKIVRRNR